MKKRWFLCFLILICSPLLMGQYHFSGRVTESLSEGDSYLSIVEDYGKISGVYEEQILYVKPHELALEADRSPLKENEQYPWWIYLLGGVLVLFFVVNFYIIGRWFQHKQKKGRSK